MMDQPATKRFRGLTPAQSRVFEQIAINNDGGHHPQVTATLEALGLITGYDETLPGRFPVRVRRFYVPLPIHMEWCFWCSEQPELTEEEQP